jgi:hypothetical protein
MLFNAQRLASAQVLAAEVDAMMTMMVMTTGDRHKEDGNVVVN